ncbi:amidohydrolase family protein [Flavobacterium gilvum]|uniref:Amidohydrolase-related domain-containing protein n=1 Tax=Flavobacterium gilvum TaxID=1492737 RepID=A0AAC9I738_9FLAO|nr:amidohydrolase family protein [Flavobacterium gilvum]AOW10965.1 hypothetical protein EM308_16560 [Flavobacterium gilvum]KFC60740.1 hypothetical protein FEM08_05050 [Flavobacterium gilvum]
MNKFEFKIIIVTVFLGSMLVAKAQQINKQYLIYNAQIVDVISGKIKKEKSVLIDNGKIKAIGDYQNLKKNIQVSHIINAGNKFLIPGLWDMHIHLEGENLVEDNKALLPFFFTYGITTVRDCASDLGEQVLEWRNEVASGKLLAPTIFTAGIKLEGINSSWKGDYEIGNEEELNAALDKLDKKHVDFIKITENTLKGPLFLKSIEEAHKRNYIVSGHVPTDLTLDEMVDAGFSSVEHSHYLLRQGCDEKTIVSDLKAGKITKAQANVLYQSTFNQEKANENYKNLGNKGLYVTPTLIGGRQAAFVDENNYPNDSLMASYLTKAYIKDYMSRIERSKNDKPEQIAERKKRYLFLQSQISYMHKAGIKIIAGSDAAPLNAFVFPGQSLIQEMVLFQQAGLSPIDVLRTSTINGARFLKKDKNMGSVDIGKIADLVLLDKNPLEDIHAVEHISGVYTKGRFFDRKALNQILENVKKTKTELDKKREVR